MEKVILGIIAEYNPFHLGHLYHLCKAREITGADKVIVALSGCFTQRGDGALLSPAARAEAALMSGVDMVFELPAVFAVREADAFALGGVSLLSRLGCTHLAFGCETDDPVLFQRAVAIMENPDTAYQCTLKQALKNGSSHAKAQGMALKNALDTDALTLPNNVLALCYYHAITKLQSPMIPVPIRRIGAYHNIAAPGPTALPSATALRAAILRGDWPAVRRMAPEPSLHIIQREARQGRLHRPNALDQALRLSLLHADTHLLSALPGANEGLDKLIAKHSAAATGREALICAIKSKRYTYTRLNRMLSHLLLRISKDHLPPLPPYARLLGLNTACASHIRLIKKGGLPIIEKAADFNLHNQVFETDLRAYDLWALGAGLPLGEGLRQSPVILHCD